MNLVSDAAQWLSSNSVALGATGAVIGIAGAFRPLLAWVSGLFTERPRISPVTSPRDPRIKAIEALQLYFPEHERDPPGLLAQKLRDSRYGLFGIAKSEFPIVCLCYQRRRKVMLFLTCQYHVPTGTVFFWYLLGRKAAGRGEEPPGEAGVEIDQDDQDERAVSLIRQMLAVCDRQGGPENRWRQVIAEVDVEPLQRARGKMRLFQTYARKLNNDNPQPSVFKVEAPFVMPVHDADMLDRKQEHETPGWLVIAPRDPKGYFSQDGRYSIGREELGNLYRVLERSYSLDGNLAYNTYLSEFFRKMIGDAPDRALLQHERHMMQ